MEKFIYEGYMSKEAQDFFKDNIETEERNGIATIGSFVTLANGDTHLPNKGDVFTKHENGAITVSSIYRSNL